MATLTDADYGQIRQTAYRAGFGKEELKALAGGLPTQAQLKAALQEVEDFMVGGFAGLKADMDTALTKTQTNAGAQKLIAAYLMWKIDKLLGI